jgi:hypothetical protein
MCIFFRRIHDVRGAKTKLRKMAKTRGIKIDFRVRKITTTTGMAIMVNSILISLSSFSLQLRGMLCLLSAHLLISGEAP